MALHRPWRLWRDIPPRRIRPNLRDYIQTDAGVSVVLYNLGQMSARVSAHLIQSELIPCSKTRFFNQVIWRNIEIDTNERSATLQEQKKR
jgi:hypothetical protein